MKSPRTPRHLSGTPRIYVASLSDYNAGHLHGRWIDADQDADAIRKEIATMLAESREPDAEEWAIHDHDNFEGYSLSEYADLEHVADVARLLAEHGPVFAGLLNNFGGDLEQARDYMEQGSCGVFKSLEDYAYELAQDVWGDAIAKLPEFIRHHIDWAGVGRDLELSGDVFTVEVDGDVHVFNSHI